jgi:molecular chaperone DnaK (HSP70)
MSASGWIVSVDFGTAFSKAAAVPDGLSPADARRQVRALALGAVAGAPSPMLAPSIVFLNQGEVTFGPLAQERAANAGPKREPLRSFKLLLGAADLTAVTASRPNRLIDPDSAFVYRELIVLYLAYLLGLVDEAFDPQGPAGAAQAQLRYTRPGWYTDRTAADHAFIRDLFAAARGALAALGAGFWRKPLTYEAAHRALKANPAPVFVDGGLFEATAVAIGFLPDPLPVPERLLVVDIGAGTTDIGAYIAAPGQPIQEIAAARRVLTIAGDAVDRAVMDAVLAKGSVAKKPDLQAAFWRSLLSVIRTQKETLFDLGRMAVRFNGKPVVVTLKEVERGPLYKSLVSEVTAAFTKSLAAAVEAARAADAQSLSLALAGGGAALPFAQDMIRRAKAPGSRFALTALPDCPPWAHDPVFNGALAPHYAKIAIALGAALAPRDILIAGGVRF